MVLDNNISNPELASAFKPERKSKKTLISIIIFVIGMIALIVGVIFLVFDLTKGPKIQDGEYLVSAKEWVLNGHTNCVDENETSEETNCIGESEVSWKFTEIGKGTLTTNSHLNDYDFIWAIEDGKLLIETKWLYDLNNEYDYKIDQNAKTLTLINGEQELVFYGYFEE